MDNETTSDWLNIFVVRDGPGQGRPRQGLQTNNEASWQAEWADRLGKKVKGRAEQGRTGQGRAGRDMTGQGGAGRGGAGRGGAGRGGAGQSRAGQSRAGQGRAEQGGTGQGRCYAKSLSLTVKLSRIKLIPNSCVRENSL